MFTVEKKSKYPEYDIIAFDNLKRRGSELNLIDFQKCNYIYSRRH